MSEGRSRDDKVERTIAPEACAHHGKARGLVGWPIHVARAVTPFVLALLALEQQAYAANQPADQICCNSLPAHTLGLAHELKSWCGANPTPLQRRLLDEIVDVFEKRVRTTETTDTACQPGQVDDIPGLARAPRSPRAGCALVPSVDHEYALALKAADDVCRRKDEPPGCCCAACADGGNIHSPNDSSIPGDLTPEPQVTSNLFAGITPLRAWRPSSTQMIGASAPLVFGAGAVSGGAGIAVSPYRLFEEGELAQEAEVTAIVRASVREMLVDAIRDGGRSEPTSPADLAATDKAATAQLALDALDLCFSVNATDGIQQTKAEPPTTPCQAAFERFRKSAPYVEFRLRQYVRARLGETLSIAAIGRYVDLSEVASARHFGRGTMVLRSLSFSVSGAPPNTSLPSSTAPRAITGSASVVLVSTGDPLQSAESASCLKNAIARLGIVSSLRRSKGLRGECGSGDGFYFGLGTDGALKYSPVPAGADLPVALEFGGAGGYASAEWKLSPLSVTAFAQTGAQRLEDGRLASRGATGIVRGTVGSTLASLSWELGAGAYPGPTPTVLGGGEGGISAAVAVPLGASLSGGASFLCVADGTPCQGRFISSIGWTFDSNIDALLVRAAGRERSRTN